MKAKDLRVGNYFMFGAMRHSCTYHDISNLGKDAKFGLDSSEYTPISLTDEWLKKFGFRKSVGFSIKYGKYHSLELGFKINCKRNHL